MSVASDLIKTLSDKVGAQETAIGSLKADVDALIQKLSVGQVLTQADIDSLTAIGTRLDTVTGIIGAEDTAAKTAGA